MTKADFYNYFLLRTDKVDTHASPSIDEVELSDLATIAMLRYIKSRYTWKSNSNKYGAEETTKRYEELGELVERAIISANAPTALNYRNGRFYNLPNNYPLDVLWLLLDERAITDIQCKDGSFLEIKIDEVSHNEYGRLIDDPFHRPNRRRAWRLGRHSGHRIELITDGSYLIPNVRITYIRRPLDIDLLSGNPLVDPVCELSDITHDELLQLTIAEYNLSISDPKYSIESQKSITLND